MHYNGQKWTNFKSHVQGVKWQNKTEQRAFSHLFNGTTKISTSITKSWSEVTPLFSEARKYTYISKQITKSPQICWNNEEKQMFWLVSFLGHSNSVFNFSKILVLLSVVHLKEKKNNFWEIKTNNIYTWYSQYKQSRSLLKSKNQDLHDLFLETLWWIN